MQISIIEVNATQDGRKREQKNKSSCQPETPVLLLAGCEVALLFFTDRSLYRKETNCYLKTIPFDPTSYQCTSTLFTRVWFKQLCRNKSLIQWLKTSHLPLIQGEMRESLSRKKHLGVSEAHMQTAHRTVALQWVIINYCCWSKLCEPRSLDLALHLLGIIYQVMPCMTESGSLTTAHLYRSDPVNSICWNYSWSV